MREQWGLSKKRLVTAGRVHIGARCRVIKPCVAGDLMKHATSLATDYRLVEKNIQSTTWAYRTRLWIVMCL